MDEKLPPWIRYAPWRWPIEDLIALGLLALALAGCSWFATVKLVAPQMKSRGVPAGDVRPELFPEK